MSVRLQISQYTGDLPDLTPAQAGYRAKRLTALRAEEADLERSLRGSLTMGRVDTALVNGRPPHPLTPRDSRPGGRVLDPDGRFSLDERKVADLLASEGHEVVHHPRGQERTPDAVVDGDLLVEFKNPGPGADSATIRNVANESRKGGGQARMIVIDARETGLTEGDALRGIARVRGAYSKHYDFVRVVGDGFDVSQEFH